jgi:preprotein translocase subunit YajC
VFPAYCLLQQFSTVVGGMTLVLLYFLWLRRQPRAVSSPDEYSDALRYGVLVALAAVAVALAVPAATELASHYRGYTALRVLVFRSIVYSIAAFIPMLTVAAIVLFRLHQRKREKMTNGE